MATGASERLHATVIGPRSITSQRACSSVECDSMLRSGRPRVLWRSFVADHWRTASNHCSGSSEQQRETGAHVLAPLGVVVEVASRARGHDLCARLDGVMEARNRLRDGKGVTADLVCGHKAVVGKRGCPRSFGHHRTRELLESKGKVSFGGHPSCLISRSSSSHSNSRGSMSVRRAPAAQAPIARSRHPVRALGWDRHRNRSCRPRTRRWFHATRREALLGCDRDGRGPARRGAARRPVRRSTSVASSVRIRFILAARLISSGSVTKPVKAACP
jgi:hypothetical protein